MTKGAFLRRLLVSSANLDAPTVSALWSVDRLEFSDAMSSSDTGVSLPPVSFDIACARAAAEFDRCNVRSSPRVGRGLGVFRPILGGIPCTIPPPCGLCVLPMGDSEGR